MRYRKISPITAQAAHEAYMSGVSVENMEIRFGIDLSTLRGHWRRLGLPTRRDGKPTKKRQPKADPGSGRPA